MGAMGRWLRLLGFTLIELMIAVAVVAILAAIAWPSYANYVLRSKVRLAQGDLAALVANVENHRQRTLSYPTAPGVAQFRGWSPGSGAGDFVFDYQPMQGGGFRVTATWQGGGKLSGCELVLRTGNVRESTPACHAAGEAGW